LGSDHLGYAGDAAVAGAPLWGWARVQFVRMQYRY